MSSERRQTSRSPVAIAVEVRDAHGFSLHSTRDISKGGLYFDRAIPHPVGTRVQVSFILPGDSSPIHCDGEVVNVPDKRDYGMGIRFLDLDDAEAKLLEGFAQETM